MWSRDHQVCEVAPDDKRPDLAGRLVVNRRYAYAAYFLGSRSETLFDLLAEHRQLLRAWIIETQDPFVPSFST